MGNSALFEVRNGLSFGNANMLSGEGPPGEVDSLSDEAGRGSTYLDVTNGLFYLKKTAGIGLDKWVRLQGQDDLNSALLGQSWRDPARLRDTTAYADLAAAETALNSGTVDGVTVTSGDRILYTAITGQAMNVFIVTGTPGSGATLVEDANSATKADALYVQEGTSAGKQYAFNGTTWVEQGSASSSEIAFLQAFMGKSGNGNELPNYPSNHIVVDNDSLEKALGDLDAEIGAAVATPQARTTGAVSDQAVNLNIEALDDALGANVSSTNWLAGNVSINANLSTLDAKLGVAITDPQSRDFAIADSNSVTSNLMALDSAIGSDNGYPGGFAFNAPPGNLTVWGKLWTLDQELSKVLKETQLDLVASTWNQVIGFYTATHSEAEYTVSIRTPGGKVWHGKIAVIHNKTGVADATNTNFNTYSIMKLGGNLSGLNFRAILDGTAENQFCALEIYTTEAAAHAQVVGATMFTA